ncbi:hypothetical protein KSS87_008260 [Heliosperma pusillum]|nr:hypothetical protein KSS87_008260 [Heliosperma pusillum]
MVELENDKLGTNDVIVTVYKESTTKRLPCPQNNKIRDRNSSTKRSCGYDRRAELLAQVHQLRNVGTHPVHENPSPTKPKPKTKRFCRVLKQFSCFWKCNKFSKNEQELHQDIYNEDKQLWRRRNRYKSKAEKAPCSDIFKARALQRQPPPPIFVNTRTRNLEQSLGMVKEQRMYLNHFILQATNE